MSTPEVANQDYCIKKPLPSRWSSHTQGQIWGTGEYAKAKIFVWRKQWSNIPSFHVRNHSGDGGNALSKLHIQYLSL